LLGRSDIKTDASKQATAGYLGLSEGAIDAIHSLLLGMPEQAPLHYYRSEFVKYPQVKLFSTWLEAMDLPALASDMYKLLMATCEYNTSELHPEKYMMSDQQKQARMLLEEGNYIVLSLRDQLDYYDQIIQSAFRESVGKLADQAAFLARNDKTDTGE
jgi:hypothetical protein